MVCSVWLTGCAATGPGSDPDLASHAGARGYDPSLVLYDPIRRRFDTCGGLSIGIDPRWENEEGLEGNGANTVYAFESEYSFAVSEELNPSPLAGITFKPRVSFKLECEREIRSEGVAVRFADVVYERLASAPTTSEEVRMQVQTGSGTWEALAYTRTTKEGDRARNVILFQRRDQRLVSLSFRSEEFNDTPVGGIIRAGTVYSIGEDGEERVQDLLARTTIVAPSGMLVAERRRSGSERFFQEVLATVQGAAPEG
ncbi:MAG: hypothetical protein AAGI09_14210 [Pseudomonadota bacterium]